MSVHMAMQDLTPVRFLRPPALLAYHGVGPADGDDARLLITLGRLESQIRYLKRRGYRFLTAEGILGEAAGAPGNGTAVLTFDDGFRSWLTDVAPLLGRLGVRGTFYVSPGLFGKQHWRVPGDAGRLLDEDGARALAADGMELGSHTLSHPDLRLLGGRELAFELRESKAAVEQLTGRPCRTLSYPYGLYDGRVTEAAAEAGYELAFAWLPGSWRPFAAPRLPAPPRHGALGLAVKLAGAQVGLGA
jgi:peptidoglycan/xylan/chitin deacetylase (PgdA/CDA1 family)